MWAGKSREAVFRYRREELLQEVCYLYPCQHSRAQHETCRHTGSIVPPAKITLLASSTTSLNLSEGFSKTYLMTTTGSDLSKSSMDKIILPSSFASTRDNRKDSTLWKAAIDACRAVALREVLASMQPDLSDGSWMQSYNSPFKAACSATCSEKPLIFLASLLSLR